MKKLLILTSLLMPFLSKSQDFTLIEGKKIEDSEKKRISKLVIGADKDNFYVLRALPETWEKAVLSAFDNASASLVFERPVDLIGNRVLSAFCENNKLIVITTSRNGNNEYEVILREINKETGTLQNPVYIEKQRGSVPKYEVRFSPDHSKLLLVSVWPDDKGNIQAASARLLDGATYKTIWQKDAMGTNTVKDAPATVNYKDAAVFTSDFCVDNGGSFMYLFSYLKKSAKSPSFGIAIHHLNESPPNIIELNEDNRTLLNVRLENPENRAVVTGEFLDGIQSNKIQTPVDKTGFFFLVLDPAQNKITGQSSEYIKGDLLNKLNYKITSKFYREQLNVNSRTEKYGKYTKFFKPYKTVYLNGCFYVIKCHEYKQKVENPAGRNSANGSFSNQSTGSYRRAVRGREIIILKYKPDGQLEWSQIIPRNTMNLTGDDFDWVFESVQMNILSSNALRIIYYDRKSNIKNNRPVASYNPKHYKKVQPAYGERSMIKPVIVCTTVSAEGMLVRNIVVRANANRIITDPGSAFLKPANSVVLKPSKGNEKFDLIRFNN